MSFARDERGNIGVGIIIVGISALTIIFVGWVWTQLQPAVSNALTLDEVSTQLNTDPTGTVVFFTALAFIALIAGLFIWFILRPLGRDVRQELRPR